MLNLFLNVFRFRSEKKYLKFKEDLGELFVSFDLDQIPRLEGINLPFKAGKRNVNMGSRRAKKKDPGASKKGNMGAPAVPRVPKEFTRNNVKYLYKQWKVNLKGAMPEPSHMRRMASCLKAHYDDVETWFRKRDRTNRRGFVPIDILAEDTAKKAKDVYEDGLCYAEKVALHKGVVLDDAEADLTEGELAELTQGSGEYPRPHQSNWTHVKKMFFEEYISGIASKATLELEKKEREIMEAQESEANNGNKPDKDANSIDKPVTEILG